MKVRLLLGPLVAILVLLAMPGVASANGGGGGGDGPVGFTFSVRDNPVGVPDQISGANDQLSAAPRAGTPRCGDTFEPFFPVVDGRVFVRSNGNGGGAAFGSGGVEGFGSGAEPGRFSFAALSGPGGSLATGGIPAAGVYDFEFPSERPSRGRVTCLHIIGNTAYVGGQRSPTSGGGGDHDDDDDHDEDDD